jgi:hypothetical protein
MGVASSLFLCCPTKFGLHLAHTQKMCKIKEMQIRKSQLPDINHLSILAAVILLIYALMPFVNIPVSRLSLRVFGVIFDFQINYNTFVSALAAAISAVGAYWLVQSHSQSKPGGNIQHIILPALTAWVIGLPLRSIRFSPQWWVVFALGGALLILVYIAEYIVVDFTNEWHAIAAGVLKVISFALFLLLAIALRAAQLRLYLVLPALVIPLALVALRTLYLQAGKWLGAWAAGIAIIAGQFVIGFQYLPITPLSFGLLLLGPAYALTDIAASYQDQESWKGVWIGPLIILALLWGFALIAWK